MTVRLYTPALGGAEEARVCQEQRDFIPAGLLPLGALCLPSTGLGGLQAP